LIPVAAIFALDRQRISIPSSPSIRPPNGRVCCASTGNI
jgi:hypothetical protein